MNSSSSRSQAGASLAGALFLLVVLAAIAGGVYHMLQPSAEEIEAKLILENSTPVTVDESILGLITIPGPPDGERETTAGMVLETASYFLALSPPPREGGPLMDDMASVTMSMLRTSAPGSLHGRIVRSFPGLSWIEKGADLEPDADGVLCYRGKPFVLIER